MTERIGIFGGTFDPPHIGHQILAAEAQHQLGLIKVLWVLTPDPPHKKGQVVTPVPFRLEMVEAAIADSADFEISRVEIDRSPPHYAVDTLRSLNRLYSQNHLVYLMGGDSLYDLPNWYQPKQFLNECHTLGVMRRPGDSINLDQLENQIPGIVQKVCFVDAPLLEIASSQIRSRIQLEQPFRYYLPPAVYRIIQKYGLYRNLGGTLHDHTANP